MILKSCNQNRTRSLLKTFEVELIVFEFWLLMVVSSVKCKLLQNDKAFYNLNSTHYFPASVHKEVAPFVLMTNQFTDDRST